MTDESEAAASGSVDKLSGGQLRFMRGVAISFAVTLCLVWLIPLAAAMVTLNIYQGWPSLGFEAPLSQPDSIQDAPPQLMPVQFQVLTPTETPILALSSAPVPLPTISPSKEDVDTMGLPTGKAIGTRLQDSIMILPLRKALPGAALLTLRQAVAGIPPQELARSLSRQLVNLSVPVATVTPPVRPAQVSAAPQELIPPVSPANSYQLIPLEGPRESRPAADHGDLNLKLRDPQPIAADLTLVDINGSGLDPDAPNLAAIFNPDFVRAYAVHDWDWGCNCRGKLLQAEHGVLVGIRTTPGAPVFIPPRKQNVYADKYYATLLYASEDSLTFAYTRAGSVARGYTIHYLGLHTDPNLVALFRRSQGGELPGLTLDTPVGTAAAELIVAVRDNGTFLDARSRRDWWE
ncbi:MAG: hypothetical protein HS126_29505 [Anaerolineales bacterium]|nr:hypothetical protein [Anaerolineales bacterium]